MVCKHPDTVKLLEVSQSVAIKFVEQAKACNLALMLNALNILNKCELDYKTSKNARLHVELCLMKLSHIQSYINLQNSGVDLKKK
jgi:DNA polymerase-3 subunit gamma/tau